MHIHTCLHTCTCTRAPMHRHRYTDMHMHAYTCILTYRVAACECAFLPVCTYTHARAHMHTCTHAQPQVHRHAHACLYMHSHLQGSCRLRVSLSSAHTAADVDSLIAAVQHCLAKGHSAPSAGTQAGDIGLVSNQPLSASAVASSWSPSSASASNLCVASHQKQQQQCLMTLPYLEAHAASNSIAAAMMPWKRPCLWGLLVFILF